MLLPAVEKYAGLVFGAFSKAVCGSEITVTNPKVDYGLGDISVLNLINAKTCNEFLLTDGEYFVSCVRVGVCNLQPRTTKFPPGF